MCRCVVYSYSSADSKLWRDCSSRLSFYFRQVGGTTSWLVENGESWDCSERHTGRPEDLGQSNPIMGWSKVGSGGPEQKFGRSVTFNSYLWHNAPRKLSSFHAVPCLPPSLNHKFTLLPSSVPWSWPTSCGRDFYRVHFRDFDAVIRFCLAIKPPARAFPPSISPAKLEYLCLLSESQSMSLSSFLTGGQRLHTRRLKRAGSR